MPMHAAARSNSFRRHRQQSQLLAKREKLLAKNKSVAFRQPSSSSGTFKDDGIQVSSGSLAPVVSSPKHHYPHNHPISSPKNGILPLLPVDVSAKSSMSRKSRSYLPKLMEMPPEEIRDAFLRQGTTYWKIVLRASSVLAIATLVQLVIYFLFFGVQGHYRIIVGLLPARDKVLIWFLSMNAADLLITFILRFGKYLSKRFAMGKDVDARFISLATIILTINFVASMVFPVYATPKLMPTVNGTVEQNSTICLEPRNAFNELGTGWDVISELKMMCSEHILCIEQCRDFRTLYFWIYGGYILSIVRLFVLITVWNTVSFLCMVKDLRNEFIGYQINLDNM